MTLGMMLDEKYEQGMEQGRAEVLKILGVSQEEYDKILQERRCKEEQ